MGKSHPYASWSERMDCVFFSLVLQYFLNYIIDLEGKKSLKNSINNI